MHRTTISLPPDLKLRAAQWARNQGVSLGELVREALEARLRGEGDWDSSGDLLFSDNAVFRGSTPPDLAERHDDYLYGEEP